MSWLIKSNRSLLAFLVTPLFLVACGGGGGDGGSSGGASSSGQPSTGSGPVLSQDTPFAFVQRSVTKDSAAQTARFKLSLAGEDRPPLDLSSPYQFRPGAKLITRSSLDVDAIDTDVLTNFFNSSDYDVKDLNISANGELMLFAAHGPNNHPTDYTWNIYEYSFKTKTMRRIIADDTIANAGQDTNPTYALDGTIVFSSDRSAGNPNSPIDNIVDEEQTPFCYKVGPDEKPSLLHSMTNQGQNILQLTYGRNHDTKPTTLKDGRIAFVRWSRSYEVIQGCPTDTGASAKLGFEQVFNSDYPSGLDTPPLWPLEKLCALAQPTPKGPVIASNHYKILRITVDGEELDQLYKTVTVKGSDEAFIGLDQIIQAENGHLVALIQHQYNSFMGGNVLELQSPESPVENKVFGNIAPQPLIAEGVDLYPNQHSVKGWFSAVWPYRDGTERMLVSWSQCSAVNNGVSSFCQEGVNEGEVSSQYGIWVVDQKSNSRLPVVRAQKDMMYSDIAISQPHRSLDFPYAAYDTDFVDDLDTSRLICTEPVNTTPVANAGPDQQVLIGQTATLDGSKSSDLDGDALIYYWTITSPTETQAVLSSNMAVMPTLTIKEHGTYVVQLIVSDGKVNSAPDTVSLEVGNVKPVANAGADRTGLPGNEIQLSGALSSDADGDALAYQWRIVSAPDNSLSTLIDGDKVNPTITPDQYGVYTLELIVNDGYVDSDPDTMVIDTRNAVPIADAGPDQQVFIGNTASLDGSNSNDANDGKGALSYYWTIISPSNTQSVLSSNTAVKPTLNITEHGIYVVQLIVSDGKVDSTPDTVSLHVGNKKPVANAGADQVGKPGDPVKISDAMGSDADGDALTYQWRIASAPSGSAAEITDSNTANPSIVPDQYGVYTLELVVNDGYINSEPDTMVIDASNAAPIANAGLDQEGFIGDTITLDGSNSSDANKDPLTYSWTIISPSNTQAVLSSNTAEKPTFIIKEHGTYIVQLVVNDGKVDSAADTVSVTVGNKKPVANAGADQSIEPGNRVQLDGSLSRDPEDDALTYRWRIVSAPSDSVAEILGSTTLIPSITPDQYGMYTIELIVNDGYADSEPDLMVIDASNSRPVVDAGPDQQVKIGQTVDLNGSATDADNDPMTYLWTITSPSNSVAVITNNTTKTPSITIVEHGTYVIQFVANDGKIDSLPDTVSLIVGNTKPVANAGVDQEANPGSQVNLDGSLSNDEDKDQLTYRWRIVSAPEGSTAELNGADSVKPTITTDQYGMYTVELVVNDGYVDSDADIMVIDASNVRPIANAGNDLDVYIDHTVTLDGSKSHDPDNSPSPITYLWTIISPSNTTTTIDNNTLEMPKITIREHGTYVVQLVVNDGKASSEPDTVTLKVVNSKPIANAGEDQSGNPGEEFKLDGSFSRDPDKDPLTYRWRVVTAPENSAAELDGADLEKPLFTPDQYGVYTIELTVNDGKVDSNADTMVIDTSNDAPIANAGADQKVSMGKPVTLDGSESTDKDGDLLTYHWTIISPANTQAVFDDSSKVAPSFTVKEHGVYVVQLVVNDGKVDSAPDTVSLEVGNVKPVADAGLDQDNDPGNQITLDGSASTDTDGDELNYQWRIVSAPNNSVAELKDADSVSPTITPDQYGIYSIELVVNDGLVDSDPDVMVINTLNSRPVADAGPDQSVFVNNDVTLDGSNSTDQDPLTYSWSVLSKPAGSNASLDNPASVTPGFTIDKPGSYVIQLIVNDGIQDSEPDTVIVTTTNVRPIADAGNDQTKYVGNDVVLNGSGSHDPDEDNINYHWALISKPSGSVATLINDTVVEPQFKADKEGTYIAQLIVNDGVLDSVPDTVTIKIEEPACDISSATKRTLPVTIRDFDTRHPDFETYDGVETGIVKNTLGSLDEGGKPVYARDSGGSRTTTNKFYFNQWYRDVPDVNINIPYTLQMTREAGSTTWSYINSDFFPINDQGFGNYKNNRNFHFTMEAHLEFDYVGGEVFTFRGDDDLWVFINGKLAIDIGGVHGVEERTIRLDQIAAQLGIQKGNNYRFDLFFAERHTWKSNFMFQTNINLECVPGQE